MAWLTWTWLFDVAEWTEQTWCGLSRFGFTKMEQTFILQGDLSRLAVSVVPTKQVQENEAPYPPYPPPAPACLHSDPYLPLQPTFLFKSYSDPQRRSLSFYPPLPRPNTLQRFTQPFPGIQAVELRGQNFMYLRDTCISWRNLEHTGAKSQHTSDKYLRELDNAMKPAAFPVKVDCVSFLSFSFRWTGVCVKVRYGIFTSCFCLFVLFLLWRRLLCTISEEYSWS